MLKSISLLCLGFFTAGPEVDLTSATPDRSAPSLTVDRDSMLKMLENSKRHKARLPLPEPTAKDRENAKTGTLGLVNNGLMILQAAPITVCLYRTLISLQLSI